MVSRPIKFKVDNSSAQVKEPLNITADGILPSASATFNVGSATLKWNVMYANEFNGKATVASSMEVPVGQGTANRTASTAASNDTVAVRDGSGDLFASNFQGTALKANYADLAEKYVTDAEYEIGTVVIFGGDKEVTHSTIANDTRVAGVISENPAYLMNKDSEGQEIALVGKVKCKVHGMISKGDLLTTSGEKPGHAKKAMSPVLGSIVGKAMENSDSSGESVILISVGRL